MSWDMVKLGDIGESFIGLTYSPDDIVTSGTPVLRSGNIQNARLDFTDIVRVKRNINESLFLREDDILICARNGSKSLIGKSALVTGLLEPMTFGAFMTVYRSPYNRFIIHFLQSENFRQQLSRSSTNTINQLTQDILQNIEVPLPSIDEQRRIAAEIERHLAAVEKAKQAAAEQLEAAQTLNAAYLREVFDGNEWEQIELGKLCEITSSKRVHEADWTKAGVPFYRAREIVQLASKGYIENGIFISEEHFADFSTKYGVPKQGDLLVTGVGTLGVSYLVKSDDKFYFKDGNIIWLKNIDKSIYPEYLRQVFDTAIVKSQIKGFSAGGTVGTYTIVSAKKTKIPLPSIEEQCRIVKYLEQSYAKTEKAITAIKFQLDTINAMPAAILRQAFSGQM